MERLLRNPTRTLVWTFAVCAMGFFVVGWLAAIEHTWGLNWRRFSPDLGFNFAAAFAQLVLAGAVWAQIKAANDALRAQIEAANDALSHARAEAADLVARERAQRVDIIARERNQRAADSLATFVGHASNASALYSGLVMSRLRDVISHPGDTKFVDLAWAAVGEANQARQAAHAERFQIAVRTSGDGAEVSAAKAFLQLLDRQHRCARRDIGWSMKFAPDGSAPPPPVAQRPNPKRIIYADPEPLRQKCLDLATELLAAESRSNEIGVPQPSVDPLGELPGAARR